MLHTRWPQGVICTGSRSAIRQIGHSNALSRGAVNLTSYPGMTPSNLQCCSYVRTAFKQCQLSARSKQRSDFSLRQLASSHPNDAVSPRRRQNFSQILRFYLMLFQVFISPAVAEFPSTWRTLLGFYKAHTWSSLTSVFSRKGRWQMRRNLSTTTTVLSIYQTRFSLGLQFSTPLPRTHNRGLHKRRVVCLWEYVGNNNKWKPHPLGGFTL